MHDPVRRDTVVTLAGLAALLALFIFGAYRPSQRACASARTEIAEADASIRAIPERVAELALLEKQLKARKVYLREVEAAIPKQADVHAVLRMVDRLAADARLTVTRLEPLAPIEHASYRTLPFRLSFSGRFQGAAQFVHGLEQQQRLFTIGDLSLRTEGTNSGRVTADILFTTYARKDDTRQSANF